MVTTTTIVVVDDGPHCGSCDGYFGTHLPGCRNGIRETLADRRDWARQVPDALLRLWDAGGVAAARAGRLDTYGVIELIAIRAELWSRGIYPVSLNGH
jgi:hypothetical protein